MIKAEVLRLTVIVALIVILSAIYVFLLIRRRRLPTEVSEPTSYFYVAWWVIWYKFKTDSLPILFAVIIFIFSFLEVAGPFTHLLPEQKIGTRIFILVILLIVAIFTLIHHHHLKKRIKQHETVISSIRVLLEDESTPEKEQESSTERTIKVLDAMVFALECEREHIKFNATVLTRNAGDNFFQLHSQDSGKNFSTGIFVSSNDSAAAKVIDEEQKMLQKAVNEGKLFTPSQRPLLYVPSVRYKHAVLIGLERRGNNQVFPTTRIVPSAYVAPTSKGSEPNILESPLCAKIPLSENRQGQQAVFCLSSHRANRMGALDFAVSRMAGVLLSRIMGDSLTPPNQSQPSASK